MQPPLEVYIHDTLSPSQAEAEQWAKEAFQAQAHRACEHIWEKLEPRVWQCEVCGDLAELGEEL